MSFLTQTRKVVHYIWNEPSNRGQRLRRLAHGILWQLRKRICRHPIPVRLWNGKVFMADPSDDMASFAVYACIFDSAHTSFAAAVSEPGAMVDVGANVGLFALQLSHLFGDGVLYEPSPQAAHKARENLSRNGLDGFRVCNMAVGDTPGRVRFAAARDTGLTNRMLGDGEAFVGHEIEVPVTTLDRDLPDATKRRLSFLKIDVEGAEAEVLSGARETLAAAPHLLVMFERLKRTPLTPLVILLQKAGYTVFSVNGGVPSLAEADIARAHDLFACRADRFEAVMQRAMTQDR